MNKNVRRGLVILVLAIGAIAFVSAYMLRNDYYLVERKSESASTNEWIPLFNGKDFDDWDLLLRNGHPEEISKVYTIDSDSSIHFFRDLSGGGDCNGPKLNQKCATHGIMVTKRDYSKYHLKFEYKWGKKLVNDFEDWQYDAGVFFHITDLKVFPAGLQYQVRYDHLNNINYSGEMRGQIGLQWYSSDGKSFSLPSNGGVIQPTTNGEWKVFEVAKDAIFHGLDNEWNQCEIIVMGKEYIIFKLNGEVVNMAVNLSVGKGPIAIEAETAEIFWRDIVIKEFEHSVPMVEFLCNP